MGEAGGGEGTGPGGFCTVFFCQGTFLVGSKMLPSGAPYKIGEGRGVFLWGGVSIM